MAPSVDATVSSAEWETSDVKMIPLVAVIALAAILMLAVTRWSGYFDLLATSVMVVGAVIYLHWEMTTYLAQRSELSGRPARTVIYFLLLAAPLIFIALFFLFLENILNYVGAEWDTQVIVLFAIASGCLMLMSILLRKRLIKRG